jgi:rhodanese-related sulfurtransferase
VLVLVVNLKAVQTLAMAAFALVKHRQMCYSGCAALKRPRLIFGGRQAMVDTISPAALKQVLDANLQFALIDVREAGEYNSTHIPGASLISRRQLEFLMPHAVPYRGTHVIVCDDDGRRAQLASTTLERLGYSRVSVLEGGINRWATYDYPTEWGMNVPSKDFGEKVEVVHHVPELTATELHERMARGEKLVILDTRTPEEYQRFCIPGGRSVPGGELALRITDLTKNLEQDTTIVVNCAGRTRSIIGTRVLQRMGLKNVYGLKNGTSGWVLAGLQLETGANRLELPEPSSEGVAAAEAYAAKLAAEDGVRYLDIPALQVVMQRRHRESVYLIDVRTKEEYEGGHIPGFRWFPGGQAVQRSDDVAVVKNCTIAFCCDRKARATFIASWYRQMGFQEVYAVDGGTTAWAANGLVLEQGLPEELPVGYDEARGTVKLLTPQALHASQLPSVIFVDTSQDFARGHVPGARWVPRGWLEFWIGDIVPAQETPIAVTCNDGRNSILASATLKELGYQNVSALDGGMAAWQAAGLPVEKGLTGVMSPPTDVVLAGPDRNFADMMNYLRWEEALGYKYAAHKG